MKLDEKSTFCSNDPNKETMTSVNIQCFNELTFESWVLSVSLRGNAIEATMRIHS